jgi:hypothetical protein
VPPSSVRRRLLGLALRNHTLTVQKDGRLRLGCGTRAEEPLAKRRL